MAIVATIFVLLANIPMASAWSSNTAATTIDDDDAGPRGFSRSDLLAFPGPFLSGLRDIKFRAQYQRDASDTDALGPSVAAASSTTPPLVVHYTTDSTNPTVGSPSTGTKAQCGDPEASGTCNNPSSATQSYLVTFQTATFKNFQPGARIRFIIEVKGGTGNPQPTVFCDPVGQGVCPPAGGAGASTFFAFRLDRTAPKIPTAGLIPAMTTGTSFAAFLFAPTADNRTPVRFFVEDSEAETPLDFSGIQIVDVADNNRPLTNSFVRTEITPFKSRFDFVYGASTPNWTQGLHTLSVTGVFDGVRNEIDATAREFKFMVDKTPPVITIAAADIVATPNVPPAPPGQPYQIVSKASTITVKATINDSPSPGTVDTNSKNAFFAQLFNNSRGLVSTDIYRLEFSAGKWQNATLKIPAAWPDVEMNVSVRVFGTDYVGNFAVQPPLPTPKPEVFYMSIDPIKPLLAEKTVPPLFSKDVDQDVKVKITDTYVDPNEVYLRFRYVKGVYKTAPAPAANYPVVGGYYQHKMTAVANSEFTDKVLAGKDNGNIISWYVIARDKAGNFNATGTLHTITVDLKGPTITETNPQIVRGGGPYTFSALVTDPLAPVNQSEVKFKYKIGAGAETSVNMTATGLPGIYAVTFNETTTDTDNISYHFVAKDKTMPTANQNDTKVAKSYFLVDLAGPAATITSPTRTTGETINVTWNATDEPAGVATYNLQARVTKNGSTTPSPWIDVLRATTLKSLLFCGEGPAKYEFRVNATDAVGNVGAFSSIATTKLDSAGCAESLAASFVSPAAGQRITGGDKTFLVQWEAASSRSFTPTSSLVVAFRWSPDDGTHWYQKTSEKTLPNTGTYSWDLNDKPSCRACKLEINVTALSGAKTVATSAAFVIVNGNATVDWDSNSLPDSWETTYGSRLGQFKPEEDTDGDGLKNSQEAVLGTDPNNTDTDNDGFNDLIESRYGTNALSSSSVPPIEAKREEEWTPKYWIVPGIGGASILLFLIGLARRW